MSYKSFIQLLILGKLEEKLPGLIEKTMNRTYLDKSIGAGVEGEEDYIKLSAERGSYCYTFSWSNSMSYQVERFSNRRDAIWFKVFGDIYTNGEIGTLNVYISDMDGKEIGYKSFREVG